MDAELELELDYHTMSQQSRVQDMAATVASSRSTLVDFVLSARDGLYQRFRPESVKIDSGVNRLSRQDPEGRAQG